MTKSRTRKPSQGRGRSKPTQSPGSGKDLLWGWHAVSMALQNDRRRITGLLCTARSESELAARLSALPDSRRAELPLPSIRDKAVLDALAGDGAVHQGVIAEVKPLPDIAIEDVIEGAAERSLLVLLDQVTDPHNVGAILRSAAAFGASAVIATDRNAAPATGVLAKSASGALDAVDLVYVTNLSRSMELLQEAGFWCIGLDGEAEKTIDAVDLTGRIAIVMGAEGSGLRRLTREHCDFLVRLPTSGPVATLNVSAATSATLYEAARQNLG
ncbi:23S rRNA (guanosine(2251)-2'-O)-methyltransferase RlmB [Nisaea acidiphila]|uniref:23S rRNA (Guanosine(2251)-2'-O)-methyltransferase RlmB n=1 Tax=Nisaea acidiphila TaxID=1862145 RepID=A0A9J7ANZ7_9PROT|nr:23S rRNA (guanosine(2251)-2'-O)-methyltransferase RlmB [Nisaea acidiphila]UUX48642.1 23S rRNA (guanosine(2251)-2'-O)-methyltransferase RlmB [Nisaea acidiphila]